MDGYRETGNPVNAAAATARRPTRLGGSRRRAAGGERRAASGGRLAAGVVKKNRKPEAANDRKAGLWTNQDRFESLLKGFFFERGSQCESSSLGF
jgi:hypothetical protein